MVKASKPTLHLRVGNAYSAARALLQSLTHSRTISEMATGNRDCQSVDVASNYCTGADLGDLAERQDAFANFKRHTARRRGW